MLSLGNRVLLGSSVVLVTVLAVTGWALDQAFRDSALVAVKERLQAQVYMLLGVADLDAQNRLNVPEPLPETRLEVPGSGLYAGVVAAEGNLVWRSKSSIGMELPFVAVPDPGASYFSEMDNPGMRSLFTLNFTVNWETRPDEPRRYTFWVAESRQRYAAEVAGFRRTLWFWLLAPVLGLVAMQGVILRWSLRPLRAVAREITAVEMGRKTHLDGTYPRELEPLTRNLNHLIHHSRGSLDRYRKALGDLAHSLKTPLAVLQSSLENRVDVANLSRTLGEQLERMNQTVDYQLQRAAASGRVALAAPVEIQPIAKKIVASLEKVYADKALVLTVEVSPELNFYGERGDLMEILGNLADNACKWARNRVAIHIEKVKGDTAALSICVDDDGPGIPAEQWEAILERGVRADEATAGHGIGLAVVRELVEEFYRGSLGLAPSALGGARVQILLPM